MGVEEGGGSAAEARRASAVGMACIPTESLCDFAEPLDCKTSSDYLFNADVFTTVFVENVDFFPFGRKSDLFADAFIADER